MDRISRFRVARLSLFPPLTASGQARYAMIASTVRNGVPHSQILIDGQLRDVPSHPTTEELLELFDVAIRQHMLAR